MLRLLSILLCRFFFRSVNISGTPYTGKSSIWCANHTGAIVDPMVMLGLAPVKLRPIAKHTLWKMPGMKQLLTITHAIPIKRLQDLKKDSLALSEMLTKDIDDHVMQQNLNNDAFQAVCEVLLEGGNILIFPEGVSHDSPYIHPLKTGLARMALIALSKAKEENFSIIIQPVSIDYSEKTEFRSDVSLHFCEPIAVSSLETSVKEIMNSVRDSLENGIASFFTWDEKRNWRFLFELTYGRSPYSAQEFRLFVENNRAGFDQDPVFLARIQTLRRMMQVIDISPIQMIWGEANQKKRNFFWLILR
ncbi:MAG: 1-acyl-sn-glycerol-3-phosphate acyltransferase, partial [Silvanigrellaceae bacterium]|nr:1-acyl-sn-glycerol-3-phosphate acyltransferase [Silvanigrellaceae bacterium]